MKNIHKEVLNNANKVNLNLNKNNTKDLSPYDLYDLLSAKQTCRS